jgi:hypothetical protein
MKQLLILSLFLTGFGALAQEHFSGISTSRRGGLLNAAINPAELSNLQTKYEVSVFSASFNLSSNRLGFNDLIGGDNIEDKLFQGNKDVDLRFDGEIFGPGFAIKVDEWAFSFQTKAYAKINFTDVDPTIGDAVTNSAISAIFGSTTIQNNNNQRANGTAWGEVAFGVSRILYEDDEHKFSAGVNLKLLFPGSYANLGADKFQGTINNNLGNVTLTDATANLNIAYSGDLAEDFTDFDNYVSSIFGNLNGFATDLGVNYQWKDRMDSDNGSYKLNVGLAVRNIGSMTFKSGNNQSSNYVLDVPNGEFLDLNQFQDVSSLEEIEDLLLASGYLNSTPVRRDFKVKLPTVFSAYADVKVIPDFYVTVYGQHKLNEDNANDQVTTQNVLSITPRYSTKKFEVYSPLASNEISGFTAGLGFGVGGFFIGSSSILTALGNGDQADVYLGFRLGLQ